MSDKKVRGHLCAGLKKYQENSTYDCIPNFTEKGFTRGCDDTNDIPIIYCPFCGKKLPKIKKYIFKCKCGNVWVDYSKYNYYCEECYEKVEPIEID